MRPPEAFLFQKFLHPILSLEITNNNLLCCAFEIDLFFNVFFFCCDSNSNNCYTNMGSYFQKKIGQASKIAEATKISGVNFECKGFMQSIKGKLRKLLLQ